MPDDPAITFAEAQARAWLNKVRKGFNTTDVPMEFCLLMEELGEAFSAWRKGNRDLGGELADVVICVDLLASALGGDLGEAVRRKFNATSEKNGLLTRLEPKP